MQSRELERKFDCCCRWKILYKYKPADGEKEIISLKQNQAAMPLFEAMRRYSEDGALAFHTPGHKQGKGAAPALRSLLTEQGLRMEVSLMKELDDLHEPTTCIKEAQALAAELYSADESYFVINGTTGAIQAMIMAAVKPGEKIIVPRNAHRSIIGGIMLSGAVPVFLQPQMDEKLGIAMGIAAESVRQAIAANKEAKAVLVINPTYYGVASDLASIAAMVHQNDMVLLVDEAHGPHLKFSNNLPLSALDAGADLVAQSTHKILGSLTQTSMLHVQGPRADRDRLRAMVSLLQSTSPNYLLLASLDAARWQMAQAGEDLIGRAVVLADALRQKINGIDGLFCFGRERMDGDACFALDVTKLTVNVSGLGLSGPQAEHFLRGECKIQCELADLCNVLFIISFADGPREADLLLMALRKLAEKKRPDNLKRDLVPLAPLPILRFTPREALYASREKVDFLASAGRASAEVLTFYPPGIPVLCPGEIITREIIEYTQRCQRTGLKVVGPDDASLRTIKVVKQ